MKIASPNAIGCNHAGSYYRAVITGGLNAGGGAGLQQVVDVTDGVSYKTYGVLDDEHGGLYPNIGVIIKIGSQGSPGTAAANEGSVCDTCLLADAGGNIRLTVQARLYATATIPLPPLGLGNYGFGTAYIPSVDLSWTGGGGTEPFSWNPPFRTANFLSGVFTVYPPTCSFQSPTVGTDLGTHDVDTLGTTITWVPVRIISKGCDAENVSFQFNDTLASPAVDTFGTSIPGAGIQLRNPSNANAIINPGDTVKFPVVSFGTYSLEAALVKVGAGPASGGWGTGRITVLVYYE